MLEIPFNAERTHDALSALQTYQQLAFGAACCERMLPNYQVFSLETGWGDLRPLRRALDAVWATCEGEAPTKDVMLDLLSEAEKCLPESEDFNSLYVSSAQDAVSAICSLLDFVLEGDLGRVAGVPELSTNSVDLIVQERENMDPRDPNREQRILEHPLMQQELRRQRRDLDEAKCFSAADKERIRAFRKRAEGESNLKV